MSFSLFRTRADLRIQTVYSKQGPDYVVSDPIRAKYFRVKFIQYLLLRFLMGRAATAREASEFLRERCDVDVDAESIEKFLINMRSQDLLEPTREFRISTIQRVRISRKLKETFRSIALKRWFKKPNDAEASLLSNVLFHLNRMDPIGALEAAEVGTSTTDCRALAELFYQLILTELVMLPKSDKKSSLMNEILYLKVPILEPEKILKRASPFIKTILSPFGLAFALIVIVMGQFQLWGAWREYALTPPEFAFMVTHNYFTALMIAQLSFSAHEFGHAMICYHYGGRIRHMGFMLFLFVFPMAFADVTDSYFMPMRRRIAVMLGGVATQIFIASATVLILQTIPERSPFQIYLRLVVFLNGLNVMINLIPVFKLDGYFILTDLVGIDNLFERSFTYCWSRTKRLVAGISDSLVPTPSPRELRWFWGYYVCTLITVAPNFLFGLTMIPVLWKDLYLINRIFFYVSLTTTLIRFSNSISSGTAAIKNLVTSRRAPFLRFSPRITLRIACAAILLVPISWDLNVNAHLVPWRTTTVRAAASGFVSQLYVREGDRVNRDRPLLRLENPTLLATYVAQRWRTMQRAEEARTQLSGLTREERELELSKVKTQAAAYDAVLQAARQYDRAFALGLISEEEYREKLDELRRGESELAIARASEAVRLAPASTLTMRIESQPTEMEKQLLHVLGREVKNLRVTSPLTGEVISPDLDQLLGRFVRKGEALLTIASSEKVVEMVVPEDEIAYVRTDKPFRFVSVGAGPRLSGFVESIAPRSEPNPQRNKPLFARVFPEPSVFRVRGRISDLEGLPDITLSGRAKIEVPRRPLAYWLIWRVWVGVRTFFWVGF